MKRRFSIPTGYAVAVLSTALATIFTRILTSVGDSGISPLFFAAVFFSAWYGGLGPGLLATGLSGAMTWYLFIPQHDSIAVLRDAVLRVLVFTSVAVLTSSLNAATKRAAEAARRARESAEEANRAKTQFVAMVSHELRVPLTPIAMVAQALEADNTLPESVRQDIQMISRNVMLEIRLIDDLVDLTRIGAGKLKLEMKALDLNEPLLEAIRLCEADARDKQLDFRTDLSAENANVIGDALRLQQIFWNLLRNAIKFTPDGGKISLRTINNGGGDLVVEVIDTGIGIEPNRLSAIFQAFEQGDPDITARFGGLGLGLAITQALAEAHGGNVTAASDGYDKGATFRFRMPTTANSAAMPSLKPR